MTQTTEEPLYHFRVQWSNKGQGMPTMRRYAELPEAYDNARAFAHNHDLVELYFVWYHGHYHILHQWKNDDRT